MLLLEIKSRAIRVGFGSSQSVVFDCCCRFSPCFGGGDTVQRMGQGGTWLGNGTKDVRKVYSNGASIDLNASHRLHSPLNGWLVFITKTYVVKIVFFSFLLVASLLFLFPGQMSTLSLGAMAVDGCAH